MATPVPPGRSFTVRGVAAGLAVGTVICAANVYFGLQTGWVSIMSMPASLMGFGIFKLLSRHLSFPFTPVENVLLQSVACGMAIMPLGCGLVGVVSLPASSLTRCISDAGGLDSCHDVPPHTGRARSHRLERVAAHCLVTGPLLFRRGLCRATVSLRCPSVFLLIVADRTSPSPSQDGAK